MQLNKILNPISILMILYAVGFVGVSIPSVNKYFMLLTPLNLLVTFLIAVYAEKVKSTKFFIMLLVCFFCGLIIELIGVHNEFLFGAYSYGSTLGIKFFDTPIIIGINWAMLTYASVSISNRFNFSITSKAFLGAFLMVFLDLLIEPVAVYFDFWSWTDQPLNRLIVAPLRNYITWFIASFILNVFVHFYTPNLKNKVIEFLYILQVIFFTFINLFVI